MKKARITGIAGQDGVYLSGISLSRQYEAHSNKRRASSFYIQRADNNYLSSYNDKVNFLLYYADMTGAENPLRVVQEIQPDDIYNLPARPQLRVTSELPEYAAGPANAREKLGWSHETTLEERMAERVAVDLRGVDPEELRRDRHG